MTNTIDKDCIRDKTAEEKKIEEIETAAFERARKINPNIEFLVNNFTIDDYCHKQWDYPGAWYAKGFKLPDGFDNEEELIEHIVSETVDFFNRNNNRR